MHLIRKEIYNWQCMNVIEYSYITHHNLDISSTIKDM